MQALQMHDTNRPVRIMVTGADGFVGRHLLPALRLGLPNAILISASREGTTPGVDEAVTLDLDDVASIADMVAVARPDAVVHLAAQSDVGASFRDPLRTWRTNLLGTVALGEAVLRIAPRACFILASSGEVYGLSFKAGTPLAEDANFAPANPYAGSKAAVDLAIGEMALRGLRAIRLRLFTHTGPGQSTGFVVAAFAHQVAKIEAGLQDPVVRTGALDRWRDFLDIRDVCAAYASALGIALATPERLPPGIAINLCSGTSRRVGNVLDALLAMSGTVARVEQETGRLRPTDVERVAGNASRAADLLDWVPRVAWPDTLRSVLDDWRGRVAAGE